MTWHTAVGLIFRLSVCSSSTHGVNCNSLSLPEANPRAVFQGGAWHQFSFAHLGSNTVFICHQIYQALTMSICITISQSLSYCYQKQKPWDRFLRHIRLNNVVIPTPQALNELLLSEDFQGLWMVMCMWYIGIMCDTKCALWWRAASHECCHGSLKPPQCH